MTSPGSGHGPLERLLAVVLRYGTWLAAGVVAAGLTRAFLDGHPTAYGAPTASSTPLVTLGLALFILLPVLRVLLMAIVFAFDRNYFFAGVAALVLLIIGLGLVLGVRRPLPASPPHTSPSSGAHVAAPDACDQGGQNGITLQGTSQRDRPTAQRVYPHVVGSPFNPSESRSNHASIPLAV